MVFWDCRRNILTLKNQVVWAWIVYISLYYRFWSKMLATTDLQTILIFGIHKSLLMKLTFWNYQFFRRSILRSIMNYFHVFKISCYRVFIFVFLVNLLKLLRDRLFKYVFIFNFRFFVLSAAFGLFMSYFVKVINNLFLFWFQYNFSFVFEQFLFLNLLTIFTQLFIWTNLLWIICRLYFFKQIL